MMALMLHDHPVVIKYTFLHIDIFPKACKKRSKSAPAKVKSCVALRLSVALGFSGILMSSVTSHFRSFECVFDMKTGVDSMYPYR